MKNTLASVIASVLVVVLGFTFFVPQPPLAGSAGPDVTAFTHFYDNVNIGGATFATSSEGTVTYTAASIVRSRVIEHDATGATTATLPTNTALSALGFLPNVGDTQSIFIHASTTKITLAAGTGMTLASASSTKAVSAGSIGRLDCVRLGVTEARNIWCLLTAD